jgi:hypothetical protein
MSASTNDTTVATAPIFFSISSDTSSFASETSSLLDKIASMLPTAGRLLQEDKKLKAAAAAPLVLPQWCEAEATAAAAVVRRDKPQFEFPMWQTIRHLVTDLTEMAVMYKLCSDEYKPEFESRLISKIPTSLETDTNIPEELFDEIMSFYASNFPMWANWRMIPLYHTHDQYYAGDIRKRRTWREVKESVESSTAVIEPVTIAGVTTPLYPQWVEKKQIGKNSDWYVAGRPLALRFSLKTERPITPPPDETEISAMVEGDVVSKSTTAFEDAFTIIYFSKVYTGEDDRKASSAKPTCSIEVECKNTASVMKLKAEDIANNLAVRTVELQGTDKPMSLSKVRY